jgi:hypothetical protein
MGIKAVVTAPRSPLQNPYVDRLISSIRREYLDHIIIFNERQLRRILSSYFQYHHKTAHIFRLTRIVLNLAQYTPAPRERLSPSGRSVAGIIATNATQRELLDDRTFGADDRSALQLLHLLECHRASGAHRLSFWRRLRFGLVSGAVFASPAAAAFDTAERVGDALGNTFCRPDTRFSIASARPRSTLF